MGTGIVAEEHLRAEGWAGLQVSAGEQGYMESAREAWAHPLAGSLGGLWADLQAWSCWCVSGVLAVGAKQCPGTCWGASSAGGSFQLLCHWALSRLSSP